MLWAAWFHSGYMLIRQSVGFWKMPGISPQWWASDLRSILSCLRIGGIGTLWEVISGTRWCILRSCSRTRQSTELFLDFTHFLREDGRGDFSDTLSTCPCTWQSLWCLFRLTSTENWIALGDGFRYHGGQNDYLNNSKISLICNHT